MPVRYPLQIFAGGQLILQLAMLVKDTFAIVAVTRQNAGCLGCRRQQQERTQQVRPISFTADRHS